MRVPTRKVVDSGGRTLVINVEDFDPAIHLGVEVEEEELAAPELKAEGEGEGEALREVAPADGSEFKAESKQDMSAAVPGPELPKPKAEAPKSEFNFEVE